jgi:hypothetical protein
MVNRTLGTPLYMQSGYCRVERGSVGKIDHDEPERKKEGRKELATERERERTRETERRIYIRKT